MVWERPFQLPADRPRLEDVGAVCDRVSRYKGSGFFEREGVDAPSGEAERGGEEWAVGVTPLGTERRVHHHKVSGPVEFGDLPDNQLDLDAERYCRGPGTLRRPRVDLDPHDGVRTQEGGPDGETAGPGPQVHDRATAQPVQPLRGEQ